MSNGCICCTVRGDLIRILGGLARRKGQFDRVIVETTGLADPGPVAQTFFMDDEVREHYELDGIVTLVDAGTSCCTSTTRTSAVSRWRSRTSSC